MEKIIEHTCPNCKHKQRINIYPIINLQTDKDLYEDLFNLNLFKITCNKCKKTTIIQYDCIVVDMFKKYIIYLFTSDNLQKFNANIDQYISNIKSNPQYNDIFNNLSKTRVVTSLNQLLEKMLIFDYDLNDKIIEIMKLGLYNKDRLNKDIYSTICFNKIENDKLIFTCFNMLDTKVQPIDISVDIKYYNIVIDSIGGKTPEETKQFDYINGSWAKQVIKQEQ